LIVAFRLTLPPTDEDRATALLWAEGTTGIEVRPSRAGRVEMLAYFEDRPGLEDSLRQQARTLPRLRLRPAAVAAVDWVARFREGFRPFQVGPFRVAPPWERPATDGSLQLTVEPGRAFGTGTHESTRLCLSALAELADVAPLGRLLDVGTGTGILAIAAVRLGASRVVAVDHDPDAIAEAARHTRLNGVQLGLVRADGVRAFRAAAFDVLVANVAAPFLLERAATLAAVTAPGGAVVLAGFLEADLPELHSRYAPFGALEERRDGDWAALVVRRPRP
jgi:ribosomal protein L11 methyltransferase